MTPFRLASAYPHTTAAGCGAPGEPTLDTSPARWPIPSYQSLLRVLVFDVDSVKSEERITCLEHEAFHLLVVAHYMLPDE